MPWSKVSGTFHSFYKYVACTHVCQGLCWLLGVARTRRPHLGPWGSGSSETETPRPLGRAGPSSTSWLLILHHHRKQNGWDREAGLKFYCLQLSLHSWGRGHVSLNCSILRTTQTTQAGMGVNASRSPAPA